MENRIERQRNYDVEDCDDKIDESSDPVLSLRKRYEKPDGEAKAIASRMNPAAIRKVDWVPAIIGVVVAIDMFTAYFK